MTKILSIENGAKEIQVHCVDLGESYLLAKIGVDTAENEPLGVWRKLFNIIQLCP